MIREFHELSPIEQTLARWEFTGSRVFAEQIAESFDKNNYNVALRETIDGGFMVFTIPDFP